jgi:hypothetical protein
LGEYRIGAYTTLITVTITKTISADMQMVITAFAAKHEKYLGM